MIDLGSIYAIRNPFVRNALHLSPQLHIPDKFELLRGQWRPDKVIPFRRHSGAKAKDVVWTTHACLFLVCNRVVSILQASAITGWSTYPVKVFGEKGDQIPGYHGFVVTGACGPIDRSRSKQVMRPPPVPNGKAYQAWLGLYFDELSWDGSHIFCPQGTGWVFVVEGVKRLLEANRVSNILFQPITEIEITMW